MAGAAGRSVHLFLTSTAHLIHVLKGHVGEVHAVAFSPPKPGGGQFLASASNDGDVTLWAAVSGEPVARLSGHAAPVLTAAFSPRGDLLTTADGAGSVRCWSLRAALTERDPRALKGHGAGMEAVALQPGGEMLATSAADGTIQASQSL